MAKASKNLSTKTAPPSVVPASADNNGDAEIIERIDAISRIARTTWLGLIGVLVFSGITILGVEDIDFFAVDRSAKLPLIGVSIPIESFFIAGALLVTSLYIYLHLYLELLWGVLGRAPAKIKEHALSEVIFPWLISEWALRRRDANKSAIGKDCATTPRTMGWLGSLISVFFVWWFGLVILALFWWRFLPAHYLYLSLGLGQLLVIAMWIGLRSWRTANQLLGERTGNGSFNITGGLIFAGMSWFLALLGVLLIESNPISANLVEAQLVVRPADWLDYEEAEKEYRAKWAKRENLTYRDPFPNIPAQNIEAIFQIELDAEKTKPSPMDEKQFRTNWAIVHAVKLENPFQKSKFRKPEKQFQGAWKKQREIYLSNLQKPVLDNRDLKTADLFLAFLPGVLLRNARMERAELGSANMEGTDLSGANLQGADLIKARMEYANLQGANLQGAILAVTNLQGVNFKGASMQNAHLDNAYLHGAVLAAAKMQGVSLRGANLNSADLKNANLKGANLRGAHMQGANFYGANLKGADFRGARMAGADFFQTNMEGANFRGARMAGANFRSTRLKGANFSSAYMRGVNLRSARLEGVRLRGAILADADLSLARIFGNKKNKLNLDGTIFRLSNFKATALRNIDFSNTNIDRITNFQNSFGDASVLLPNGQKPPCQWGKIVLDDTEFFGRWRGWREIKDRRIFGDLVKYKSIPAPPNCMWKLEK